MRLLPLLALLLVVASPFAPSAQAETEVRDGLSSREAAWLFGIRFVRLGLGRLDPPPFGLDETRRALDRLQEGTGVRVRPYPAVTGDARRDGRALATFFVTARPKLAAAFERRFDRSHAALFRIALDSGVLGAAYGSAPELAKNALEDMERSLVHAHLPARPLLPVRLAYDDRASDAELGRALRQFEANVRLRLREQKAERTPDRFAAVPPRPLEVWLLGMLASNATVLHVYDRAAERPEIREALDDVAAALDVPRLELPARIPSDARATAAAADAHLRGTWAPQVVDRLEHRYAGPEPHLVALALEAGRLRLGYEPGAAASRMAADLATVARFAGLPEDLFEPLTERMAAGASFAEVGALVEGVLAAVRRHLAGQPARSGADDPEGVTEGLMLAARLDDPVSILALCIPDRRAQVALDLGLTPLLIRLRSMARVDGVDREVRSLETDIEALIRQHGIDEAAVAELEQAQSASDKAARARNLLAKTDPGRFLLDTRALRLRYGGTDAQDPYAWSNLVPRFFAAESAQGGTTATAMIEGRPDPLRIVRLAGRWYVDPTSLFPK